MNASTRTICTVRFDRKVWTGPPLSMFIVYGLDTGHLALRQEPVPKYEWTAFFREKARATVKNGQYLASMPAVGWGNGLAFGWKLTLGSAGRWDWAYPQGLEKNS